MRIDRSRVRLGLLLLLGVFLTAGCASEKYLVTEDGLRMAYHYRKASPEKGAVLLLHGMGSSYDEWHSLAGYLSRNGWSTMAIDFRGHGSSVNWNGKEVDWRGFSRKGFLTMAFDIKAAREFLGPVKPVWLIGSSMGANMALYYAGVDKEISGLVLLSPGFSYAGLMSEPLMKAYGARPILIAGSADDPGTLEIAQRLMGQAEGPKELLRFQDAGHGAAMLDYEKKLKKDILEWMNRETT